MAESAASIALLDGAEPAWSTVDLAQILKEHPERVRWQHAWEDYRLLYRGGEEFLSVAGEEIDNHRYSAAVSLVNPEGSRRIRRFLKQLAGEPDAKYRSRLDRAVYVNDYASVMDFFTHWLFSQQPEVRPADTEEAPSWYAPFAADCDGKGTPWFDFLRDAFLDSLQTRYTGWAIGTPDMATALMSQAEAEESNLDGVRLMPYVAEEILDWEENEAGDLEWVTLAKERTSRRFPDERRTVRLYLYLDRYHWAAWEQVTGEGDREVADLVGSGTHGIGKVPFVRLELSYGLWVGNKLASWAIDLFNQLSMLSDGELLSCFMQPMLTSQSGEGEAISRVMGPGYMMHLRCQAQDRGEEKFGWASPSVEPLKFSADLIDRKRDDGYRTVHQMAMAVNPSSASTQQRSGLSKSEDRLPTEIILSGYGNYMRRVATRTLDLVSLALGDNLRWMVAGFDSFNVRTLAEELQEAALVDTLRIPSPTFRAVVLANLATGRVVGHADEATRQKIRDEIKAASEHEAESGVTDHEVLRAAEEQMGESGEALPQIATTEGTMPIEKTADTALNGAQVTALQGIVASVALREIPRETGVAMIAAAFPLTPEQADHIMGDVGRGFFAEEKPNASPPTP